MELDLTSRNRKVVVEIARVNEDSDFPEWTSRSAVEIFLNEKMRPYHDALVDVSRALGYAFSAESGKGGFLLLASVGGRLVGALVMLRTGMKGYVPENLLLFVGVDPELRNQGIGRKLVERGISECEGDVKLHVERDNPAGRLYERLGFKPKYVEMRYSR